MKDDISQKISSAYHAVELAKKQAIDEEKLDRRAKQSSIKLESLLAEQTKLLKEANERAASMEKRAEESEKQAKGAKRHAVLANVVAIVALLFTVFQYFSGN